MVIVNQKHFFKDLYESIEKNCSAEQLKNFANLGSDESRFSFIQNLDGVNKFNELKCNDEAVRKCAANALQLKKEGNTAFQAQNYAVALQKYTESQLVTPTNNGKHINMSI